MERTYGVTPPISTALPTEDEKRANDALAKELRAQGTFEAPSETQKREDILKCLGKIADEFVKRAAMEKEPKNTFLIRNARGKIFTYGSYRLGVYGPGSDIDTLIVAPKYVTAEQYFSIFPGLLMEMAPPGAITDLNPVPEAFVPIIKFEFQDISIDLIFCPIQVLKELPEDKDWNLQDNGLLRGLNENQVRSLNGTRVTDEILNLVPEPATFRLAIRAIKLWAQRKAIYANILGYPGGIAWNLMVARVCQLYPKATSSLIVNKFFNLMLKWPWPLPVLLRDIEYGTSITRVPVWNPKIYASDRNHRMPIITPSYPSMCTTHNVGRSAMIAIQQELELGAKVTDEIMLGKRPWKDLFQKHTFFTTGFRYYLTVVSSSKTKDAQNKWSSFIESRVRYLVQKLDLHPSIALARPFNKGYDRVHRCRTDAEIEQVQGGSLAHMINPEDLKEEAEKEVKNEAVDNGAKSEITSDATSDIKKDAKANGEAEVKGETKDNGVLAIKEESVDSGNESNRLQDMPEHKSERVEVEIYTTNHYIGLQLAEGAKSLDLSREVNEFKAMCQANDIFKGELMCLTIQHLRNFDLPDDVFEPGEIKPTRPLKKKRPVGNEPTNPSGKRVAADESIKPNAKRQATAAAVG